jgi:hypothetical protein
MPTTTMTVQNTLSTNSPSSAGFHRGISTKLLNVIRVSKLKVELYIRDYSEN